MLLTISKGQIQIYTHKLTTLIGETTHAQPSHLVPPCQNFQNPQSYPPYVPPLRKPLEGTLHSFIEKKESINNQTMQTLTNSIETICNTLNLTRVEHVKKEVTYKS